jgi:very-short-patch-repair endonuclease
MCASSRPRRATVAKARSLRRSASVTEQLLWRLLRDRRLEGLKFRRQVPMGPYVVDFVCFRHRLVVEADGPFHDPARDEARDAWLAGRGLRVLRFPNSVVQNDREVVLERIMDAAGRPPLMIEV